MTSSLPRIRVQTALADRLDALREPDRRPDPDPLDGGGESGSLKTDFQALADEDPGSADDLFADPDRSWRKMLGQVRRRSCPNPCAKHLAWSEFLAERSHLKALQLHLRARGHRAVIVRDGILGPGVRDESGNLHMTFGGMAIRERKRHPVSPKGTLEQRRARRARPTWPLFTMWQGVRLVLLKKPQRRLTGLKAKR